MRTIHRVWMPLLAGLLGLAMTTNSFHTMGEKEATSVDVCAVGCDYASIQEAVAAVPPGGVILVREGTYEENLVINKSLTIKGVDPELVHLRPKDRAQSALFFSAPHPEAWLILENLTLSSAVFGLRASAITAFGGRLVIRNCRLLGDGGTQIGKGSGTGVYAVTNDALIVDSQFLGGATGLELLGTSWVKARATIRRTQFDDSISKAVHLYYAEATIEESSLSGTALGGAISVGTGSKATIRDSRIFQAEVGISVAEAFRSPHRAEALLVRNRIFANEIGVATLEAARVSLVENLIVENGTGVLLGGASEATLERNRIKGNKGWGVALRQRPCWETKRRFTGKVLGRANEIVENGRGDLCPEDYAWPEGFKQP